MKKKSSLIIKNLNEEAAIKDKVAYFPVAGESTEKNFRSPDSYVFILFEKCRGTHTIDFVNYEEKDAQIHISFPGQIHSWNTEAGARGHKLIVSKKLMEMFLFNTHFSHLKTNDNPVIDISKTTCRKLSQEFQLLKEDLLLDKVNWEIVAARTHLIIAIINSLSDQKKKSGGKEETANPYILKLHSLIDENFMKKNKSVSFFAGKLAITPNYLNILCRRYIGKTAKEVIDQKVVLEAKRLLLGSAISIKEIAYDLGFADQAYFSTYIQSKTGMYPNELRDGK